MLERARRISTLVVRAACATALVGTCMASSCFGNDGTDTSGVTPASTPSIEVTVDGTHAGPFAADSTAYADLVDSTDATTGELTNAMLTLHASGGGDLCSLTLQRYGTDIAPFAADPYTLVEPTDGETPDRTASLDGEITVTAGGLTLTCGSDDCAALFVVNALDAAHIEGYLTATMENPSTGAQSSVVVTFYVPWQTYSP